MSNIGAEARPQKSKSWPNWSLGFFAVIAFGFVVGNIFLHRTNMDLQEELAQRQQFINESIRLSRLNTQLVQALATMSAQTNDDDIRSLLADHGIQFTATAANSQESIDE